MVTAYDPVVLPVLLPGICLYALILTFVLQYLERKWGNGLYNIIIYTIASTI